MDMIQKQFRVQIRDFKWYAGIVLGCFIVGNFLMWLIISVGKEQEWAALGTIFGFFGAFGWLFGVGVQMGVGIDWPLSMGRTRLSCQVAHYAVGTVFSLMLALECWLLSFLEDHFMQWALPGMKKEFDVYAAATLPRIAGGLLAGMVVATFLGALVARFGKKAFWLLWALWMIGALGLPRVMDAGEGVRPEDMSLLQQLAAAVKQRALAVPSNVWWGLAVLVLVGCIVGSWLLIHKKAVMLQ